MSLKQYTDSLVEKNNQLEQQLAKAKELLVEASYFLKVHESSAHPAFATTIDEFLKENQ